jgi:hypothetical protein
LDQDGKPDLAVAHSAYPVVSVIKNTSTNGAISFDANVDYVATSYQKLSIGDLDGDGNPDLAVARNNPSVSVFKNAGKAGVISFNPKVDFGNYSSSDVSIGDMDGDGIPDLVVSTPSTISILRGLGTALPLVLSQFQVSPPRQPYSVNMEHLYRN